MKNSIVLEKPMPAPQRNAVSPKSVIAGHGVANQQRRSPDHHMNVGPGKWSTACAVLLSAAALLSAAPASADPIDDAFVAALAKDGITMSGPNTAIAMAHTVCAGFDKNENTAVLAMRLMKDTDLSLKQSSYFVGASVSAYCPQYIGHTDNSLNWLKPYNPVPQW